MAWTITISEEPDSTGEKTVTATWNDQDLGVFSFSRGYKSSQAGVNNFAADAIAKRNLWKTRRQNQIAKETELLTTIVAADV